MFNIKKGTVHGYNHNSDRLRDANSDSLISEVKLTQTPKNSGKKKAFKSLSYKHNAPELVSPRSKGGKMRKFGAA